MNIQFLTPKAVCSKIGLSRATLDRLVLAGDFPKPLRLTERRLVYKADDVEGWMLRKADEAEGRA